MKEIKTLSVIDGKSLLGLDVEPPKFIIAGLMQRQNREVMAFFMALPASVHWWEGMGV